MVVHRRRHPAGDVDVGDDAVHRVRPGQVVGVGLVEAEHADDAVAELVVEVRPGRQRHRPDVGDLQPALGHGGLPALVGGEDRLDGLELGVGDRHLAVGDAVDAGVAQHLLLGDRHQHVTAVAGGAVEQQHPQPALDRFAPG